MATKNAIENGNTVVEPIMDEEAKIQFIKKNIMSVPRLRIKKFQSLDIDGQVVQLQHYIEQKKLRDEYVEKNKLENKVAALFEQRHGTVEDAKNIIKYMQNFIDSAKEREIAKLDEEIAKLEAMKKSLED